MSYEANTGLNVNNHYGPRPTGGTEGVTNTGGTNNEFMIDLDLAGLDFGFPVVDGSAYVTIVDTAVSNATTFTIGGVNVVAATDAAPVLVPAANTGVIVTDGTTGKILVTYNKYAL
jgi:hypothetical protein